MRNYIPTNRATESRKVSRFYFFIATNSIIRSHAVSRNFFLRCVYGGWEAWWL